MYVADAVYFANECFEYPSESAIGLAVAATRASHESGGKYLRRATAYFPQELKICFLKSAALFYS